MSTRSTEGEGLRADDGAAPAPKRVVLAEHDPEHRARLADALAAAGYAVTTAETGEEALTAYVRTGAALVVLDTELPGVDGVEVCRRIRALDPARQTLIIAFSYGGSLPRVLAALEAGADDYCLEPTLVEHVRARLMIAERRLGLEEARRSAEGDAARSRYLAGVGEMAIALQHEINNPLAAILAHAELLAMDENESGETSESLQTILEQARRIADVVRRLSSLRNPTSVEYVPGKRMVHLKDDA